MTNATPERNVVAVVTDEVEDEHYILRCQQGCVILPAADPAWPKRDHRSLLEAADFTRRHSIITAHAVEIIDTRVEAGPTAEDLLADVLQFFRRVSLPQESGLWEDLGNMTMAIESYLGEKR